MVIDGCSEKPMEKVKCQICGEEWDILMKKPSIEIPIYNKNGKKIGARIPIDKIPKLYEE